MTDLPFRWIGGALCLDFNNMRSSLLAIVLAVLVAACGSSSSTPAPTSNPPAGLQAVQLRTSDVPASFYRAGIASLTPNQAAQSLGIDPARYRRAGGGAASAERFVLRHPATVGLTFIASQVFAFGSTGSASLGFHLLRTALAHSGTIATAQEPVRVLPTPTLPATFVASMHHPAEPPPTPYQTIRVPPVGREDAGFTNDSASYAGEFVFTNRVVLFRQGRYCAIVHLAGDYGEVPLSAALALARRIDGRIRSISSS